MVDKVQNEERGYREPAERAELPDAPRWFIKP
jgi:hypothetical protein